MAAALVGAVQSMSDDQAELLAMAVEEFATPKPPVATGAQASDAPPVNPSARQNIRPILTLIRSQSTVPPREVLNTLLTLAWNAGAREYVQRELLTSVARSKNQPPMNNVSWTITETPTLETEAAPNQPIVEKPSFLEVLESPAADRAALREQFDKIKVE